jgi:hypothetical protein
VTTTLPPATEVTGPGVYNLPADEYHARPELSSSAAKKLLPPYAPAIFKHERDNGTRSRRVFELGTAAHKLVLGAGPELVAVTDEWGKDPNAWRTDKVKERLAEIRDRGDVPLKRDEYDYVHAMADALRAHPFAAKLFEPGTGEPERTLIWRDAETGIMCRALLDWLPFPTGGRFILRDYKSAAEGGASPEKLPRTVSDLGYYFQLAWHLAGAKALGLAGDDAEALLVVQERTAPYLVTVGQPDFTAMRLGELHMRQALRLYAECMAADEWPGYSDDVVLIELPAYFTRELRGEVW